MSGLAGHHVVMGLWGSLRHDARVVRAAATLAGAGARVTVVGASWHEDERGRWRHPAGFDCVTVPRPKPWSLMNARPGYWAVALRVLRLLPAIGRFWWALRRLRGDVYHAHDIQALPWTWLACRRRPLIYDAHEIATDGTAFTRVGRFVAWLEKRL
ncbi:glycosyltransferase, partial [Gammaproteobacteria bacterium AB-CW1]|nr:glycosyltransferase [Gammaproteobacteria bacterium AB-CW1]